MSTTYKVIDGKMHSKTVRSSQEIAAMTTATIVSGIWSITLAKKLPRRLGAVQVALGLTKIVLTLVGIGVIAEKFIQAGGSK